MRSRIPQSFRRLAAAKPALAFMAVVGVAALGSESKIFQVNEGLLDGKPDGIRIFEGGRLRLGPRLARVAEIERSLIWSLAVSSDGRIALGTGHEGELLRLSGKDVGVMTKVPDREVTALAFRPDGTLFLATAVSGKVYRLSAGGKLEEFFDPGDRYVWALSFAGADLLVGTGSDARIYRVDPAGKGRTLLESNAQGITSIVSHQGDVYAGSASEGRLYRVHQGDATVIYKSESREVVDLALIDHDRLVALSADFQAQAGGGAAATLTVSSGSQASTGAPPPNLPGKGAGKSRLVVIPLSGKSAFIPETVWHSDQVPATALSAFAGGVVFSTAGANRCRLISWKTGEGWSVLADITEGQVSAISPGEKGSLLVATSYPGRVYRLDASAAAGGVLLSKPLDAGGVARFGKVELNPEGAGVKVSVRTGNALEPGPDWTDWTAPDGSVEKGRYLQFRLDLSREADPQVEEVSVPYRQGNVAPIIDSFELLFPGVILKQQGAMASAKKQNPAGEEELFGRNVPELPKATPPPSSNSQYEFERGMRTVTWNALDKNSDELRFALSYAPVASRSFLPLVSGLARGFYQFDTTSLPDGRYRLRLEATDRLSNPAAEALQTIRDSRPFLVDHRPPRVTLSRRDGAVLFDAVDAELLFHAYAARSSGSWVAVEPEDGITDERQERYRVDPATLPGTGPVLLFKVFDRSGNVGSLSVRLDGRRVK